MLLPCACSGAWIRAASDCLSWIGLAAADAAPRRARSSEIPTSTPSRRWFRGVKPWPPLAFGGSSVRVLSKRVLGQRVGHPNGACSHVSSRVRTDFEHRSQCFLRGGGWPRSPRKVLRYGPNVADAEYRTERDSMGEGRVAAHAQWGAQ